MLWSGNFPRTRLSGSRLSWPRLAKARFGLVLKGVRPGWVRTTSVWDWSSSLGKDGDCDVIDVNSAPDESAKESSYFHVHGSHLQVLLAWSFPSPCVGRLCSHVMVALVWLLQCQRSNGERRNWLFTLGCTTVQGCWMLPRSPGSHRQEMFCCNPSWPAGSRSHQLTDWGVGTPGWPLVCIASVVVCRR